MSDDYTKVGLLKKLFRAITGGDIVDPAVDTTSECIDQFCKFYDGNVLAANFDENKVVSGIEVITVNSTSEDGVLSFKKGYPSQPNDTKIPDGHTITSSTFSLIVTVSEATGSGGTSNIEVPISCIVKDFGTVPNTFDRDSGNVTVFGFGLYRKDDSVFIISVSNWRTCVLDTCASVGPLIEVHRILGAGECTLNRVSLHKRFYFRPKLLPAANIHKEELLALAAELEALLLEESGDENDGEGGEETHE